MPANTLDSYYMQDSRNNFDAMRPVPVCSDANQIVGQCHRKIHISNNCYYGYQLPQVTANKNDIEDCEMMEVPAETFSTPPPMQGCNARKRGAELLDYAQCKRLKEGTVHFVFTMKVYSIFWYRSNNSAGPINFSNVLIKTCLISNTKG